MRAEFQKQVVTLFQQSVDPCHKAHCFSGLTPPIAGIQKLFRRQDVTGQVGDQRDARRLEVHLPCDSLEVIQHRLQQRRMKSMRHRQDASFNSVLFQSGD